MNNEQLVNLLEDSTLFEVNKIKPRAYKSTFSINGRSNDYCLNGKWDFAFYEKLEQRNQTFFMNDIQLNDKIEVPSHIELNGYGQLQYVNVCYPWDGHENLSVGQLPNNINVGQYKRTFEYKSNENSYKQYLCFEGVEQAFNVWINERYVGYSEDTFTESEFDITDYLIEGDNTISVEVYQYTASSWLEDQDFWRFFGIFRDVILKDITKNSILDFDIKYDLDVIDKKADLKVNCDVTSESSSYKLEIFDDSTLVFDTKLQSTTKFTLNNLILWTCETPKLYNFVFSSETEMFSHKIGFRKISFEDKILCINNKRIVFKGINRHEFNCNTGRTISKADIEQDVKLIKSNNFNAIRTSHYPNHPYFYQLCDELGLYVIDEANLETHGTWLDGNGNVLADTALPDDNKRYKDNIMFRMQNMHERDKNFTSIVSWSLGNESYGGKTLFEASEYFRSVDKSRFVHYEGITWDRRFNDTSDVESRMYTRSEELEEMLESGMEKPIIMCEYSHAMGNSNGNITDYLNLEKKYDLYQGGFIWEYMDQVLKIDGKYKYGGDFDDRPTDYDFICDGLFGPEREIKPDTEYIALQFSPLKIKEVENTIHLTSNLQFANLDVKCKVYVLSENDFIYKNDLTFDIQPGQTIIVPKELNNTIKLQFENANYKLQSYTYGLEYNKRNIKKVDNKINFVDTPFYFSVKNGNDHVMFSKASNNLSSIKYNNCELLENIESGFKPNFWRAPTSNDKGANKHNELGIWYSISKYSNSKITDYFVKDNALEVVIQFTNNASETYLSEIHYIVYADCSFSLKFKTNLPKNTPAPFCAGINVFLKSDILIEKYIGNGPFDSYTDRKENMDKSVFYYKMSEGYFVPQEYGNKTNVNYVRFNKYNNSLFSIEAEQDFELNYKKYTDSQLEMATHRDQLYHQTNELKLNAAVAGVGGDDSWMTWCKDEHQLDSKKEYELEIYIRR